MNIKKIILYCIIIFSTQLILPSASNNKSCYEEIEQTRKSIKQLIEELDATAKNDTETKRPLSRLPGAREQNILDKISSQQQRLNLLCAQEYTYIQGQIQYLQLQLIIANSFYPEDFNYPLFSYLASTICAYQQRLQELEQDV